MSKRSSFGAAAAAIASKSAGHREAWPAVANPHARLASSIALNSATRGVAAAAIASKSCGAAWPAVAKAHAVLASS